jgi:chromosome segregation protein
VDEKQDLSAFPEDASVVTPSGRRRDAVGCYVLGTAGEAAGLISRRSHLQSLEEELDKLFREEKLQQNELDELSRRREHYEIRRSDLARQIMKIENFMADRSSDLNVLSQERSLLESRDKRLEERRQGLEGEIGTLNQQRGLRQGQLNVLGREIPSLEEQQGKLQDEKEASRKQQEVLREQLVNARLSHNRLESDRERMQTTRLQFRANLDESMQDIERLSLETSKAEEQLEILEKDSNQARQSMEVLFDEKRRREEALNHVRQRRSVVEEKKKIIDVDITELLPQVNAIQKELSQHQMDEQEASLKLSTLLTRIREDYQIDIAHYQVDKELLENVDLEIWRKDCKELKQNMDRLGAVNLEALQEETELDAHYAFLNLQEKDLRLAIKRLEEVVEKIDTRARKLFLTTFELVREHFKVTFRQLFGGGRADLKFEENEEDVLESGIEITACPPGKEPRSISLLSGGEKTMTAVALLFAVFKSRPSPFCILDEVDAALDESNIDRWLAMLDKYKQITQFLVITHSKRTMREASMIYGVTMQEPGVSCKLSMKFEEIDRNEDFTSLPDNKVA